MFTRGRRWPGWILRAFKQTPGAHLATFVFRASEDASGEFGVELLHDDTEVKQRTFLFPTSPGAKIALESSAAKVRVQPARGRVNP
jgi:hypothetical protein